MTLIARAGWSVVVHEEARDITRYDRLGTSAGGAILDRVQGLSSPDRPHINYGPTAGCPGTDKLNDPTLTGDARSSKSLGHKWAPKMVTVPHQA